MASRKLFFYEGKDVNEVKGLPCCVSCWEQEGVLNHCPHCKMVRYCSDACLKDDLEQHGGICRRVNQLMQCKEIRQDAAWDVQQRTSYMKTRVELAMRMYTMAHSVDTAEAWDVARDNFQEALSLSSVWHLPAMKSYHYPYVLLTRDQDDEAFEYCSFWLKSEERRHEISSFLSSRSNSTADGQNYSSYPPSRDGCRHLDIFKECPDCDSNQGYLTLLLVIAIIKMRLVAHYESYKRTMALFREQYRGHSKTIAPVAPLISEMLVGCRENDFAAIMEPQGAQLNRLLDYIEKQNPSIFKALWDPRSFTASTEIHPVLLCHAGQLWGRIPGATLLLQRRSAVGYTT